MKQIPGQPASALNRLSHFFYAQESPYGLALARMFIPAAVMIPMVMRFAKVRELFSTDGTPASLFEMYGHANPLPVFGPQLAAALYGLMLFAFFCAIAGWKTRIAFCIGLPLYVYFNLLDSVGTLTKYSVIGTHLLLMLTVSNCGAVWSVDALLRQRNASGLPSVPPTFAVWPARLMQLLFCFVYFGAAITKIQTESFFSGEQMRYWMLSNWNYQNPVGERMAMWTPMLLMSAYITVVWEIVFAFLVWRPGTRLIVLFIGATFHFMTWVTLGLYIFPAICLSGYLAFINERDIVFLRNQARRFHLPLLLFARPMQWMTDLIESRPASLPASAAFVSMALLCAVAASEAEYRMDAYGMLASGGPMALPQIDREIAVTMINDKRALRERDKYFSFDIGTLLVGGQLAGRNKEYSIGETIIAQCNLNPPHEDLWVECLLVDEHDRPISQSGQFVTRDMLHANFYYGTCDSLVPGNYAMILRSSGKDIYKRRFRLNAADGSACEIPQNEMLTN